MDDFNKFLKKSYNFLSYRVRSEYEVKEYLRKQIKDNVLIESIIQKLKEQKFINDKEFVRIWIESRSRIKPKALRVIVMELKRKGISKELIDEVLENEELNTVSDFQKAYMLAQKKIKLLKNDDSKKVFEKLMRYLASKGFNYETIKEVVDQIIPKRYNNGGR